MTSIRSRPSTSLISVIDRSWPMASGVSVSGNGTASRSGSTGSVAGSSRSTPISMSRASPSVTMSIIGSSRCWSGRLDRHRVRLVLGLHERQLDAQDAVVVGGLGLVGGDVGAELDRAPERPVLDLDLLVDAALGLVQRAPAAGDDQLASADLQVDLADVDPGQLGGDDRPRRIADVGDVDARREAGAAMGRERAVEDAAEQLVHLAAHALEVGEDVALGHGPVDASRRSGDRPKRPGRGCRRVGSASSDAAGDAWPRVRAPRRPAHARRPRPAGPSGALNSFS